MGSLLGLLLTVVAGAGVVGLQVSATTLVVRVQADGRPVAGAEVRAGATAVRSDAAGEARLTLPAGAWEVEVSAPGHAPLVLQVHLAGGTDVTVDAALQRLSFEEDVIVTATRSHGRLREQPLRIEVIGREEIEEKALMTPGSVAMLLGETTGLRVQTTAPSLGAANVRIQGLRGRYSQVLSDGLPLHGAQADSLTLLQVPPLDLGQVEIIKGAASALHGASALGGVINLVSRRPVAREREALLNATSLGGADLTLWLADPPRGGWSWTVLGGYHAQQRRDLDEDGWTDVAGFSRGLVRPRVFWDGGAGRTLFATAGVMREAREGGTLPGGLAPDGRPFDEALGSTRADAGAAARLLAGRHHVLMLRGAFARQHQDRQFGAVRERGTRTTWFGEAAVQGAAGAHVWVLGAAWQEDEYDARDLPAFDYRFRTPAVFAQDEIAIGDTLAVALSGRVDVHSEYGTLASPRVSVLARPSAGWTFRVSAGAGAFAPTPFTEETDATGFARVELGRSLRAERAAGGSVDVTRTVGPVEVTGTVFGSRVRNPVQVWQIGPDRVLLANVGEPTRTAGTELIVRFRAEGFVAMVTHGWTRSTEADPERGGRRRVPLTPGHAASVNVMWEDEAWGRFGIEAYYTGRQPLDENPWRATGRPYLLAGALFERRVGRARWFVNAENLANVRQTRWDPLLRPARHPDGRWTVDAWAPLDGVTVNGGVRVAF